MAEDMETITLVDDEGIEHEFQVLDGFECDEHNYVVLVPPEVNVEEAEDVGDAYILRLETDAEGNEVLADIEDQEEWNRVCAFWEELQEEETWDEGEEEEEEEDEE